MRNSLLSHDFWSSHVLIVGFQPSAMPERIDANVLTIWIMAEPSSTPFVFSHLLLIGSVLAHLPHHPVGRRENAFGAGTELMPPKLPSRNRRNPRCRLSYPTETAGTPYAAQVTQTETARTAHAA